jgi:uncharacterized iron-regulated membrane protein
MRAWKAGLVALGIVFPLMGATVVAVWLVDRFAARRDAKRAAEAASKLSVS